jgi:uncharacterized membrane-anchored protein
VFVVRLVTLAALVLALGGSSFALAQALRPDIFEHAQWIVTASGAIVLVGLFTRKFVGPPPHAFMPRAALALLITAAGAYASLFAPHSTRVMTIEVALGVMLLTWYAREHAG